MHSAIRHCALEAAWKLKAIMRTRRYFNDRELITLFKSHVLSYVEYRTPAFLHASSSLLQPIDHLFDRLLSYTGVSYCDALIHFNLGPLSVRRDIAALGIIHRAVLGQGPAQLKEFFVLESSSLQRFTRLGKRRHGKQLRDEYEMLHRDFINRSIFG